MQVREMKYSYSQACLLIRAKTRHGPNCTQNTLLYTLTLTLILLILHIYIYIYIYTCTLLESCTLSLEVWRTRKFVMTNVSTWSKSVQFRKKSQKFQFSDNTCCLQVHPILLCIHFPLYSIHPVYGFFTSCPPSEFCTSWLSHGWKQAIEVKSQKYDVCFLCRRNGFVLFCLVIFFFFSQPQTPFRVIDTHSWDNASTCSSYSEMPHILVSREQQSDWLTVKPITQPLRPIVQAKAHKSRIITCCMLLLVCPTTSLCKIHCTWSKYILFLRYSQGWGQGWSLK